MTLFIIFHVLVCTFLVIVILLQPGKGDSGIGFGSSSSQSIFGSRGAGNFLTKTTSACAIIFLATSFVLTRTQIAQQRGIKIESIPAAPITAPPPAPAAAKPAIPPADAAKSGESKIPASGKVETPAKAVPKK